MALYPVLIEFEGAPVLVAGGGKIALHNAELFSGLGADVAVVAPEICPEIYRLSVRTEQRCVRAEDAEGKVLVVDATGDPGAQNVLSEACRASHTPYICAGQGDLCTAMLPAVYRKGRTLLAVSSTGASPAASAWLRDRLAEEVPESMDGILDMMAKARRISREAFELQSVRSRYLHACLDEMLRLRRPLSEDEELQIRQSVNDNKEV